MTPSCNLLLSHVCCTTGSSICCQLPWMMQLSTFSHHCDQRSASRQVESILASSLCRRFALMV